MVDHGDARALEGGYFGPGVGLPNGGKGAGMAHDATARLVHTNDQTYDGPRTKKFSLQLCLPRGLMRAGAHSLGRRGPRMVFLDPGGSLHLPRPANFTDQGNRIRIRVSLEYGQGLAEVCSRENVAANPDTQALPETCTCCRGNGWAPSASKTGPA